MHVLGWEVEVVVEAKIQDEEERKIRWPKWENSERKYGADRRCLGFLIRHAALTVYYTYSSTVYSSTL